MSAADPKADAAAVAAAKRELRARMRAARAALPPEQCARLSEAAQAAAAACPAFGAARLVAVYLAAAGEVGTGALIARCYREGRSVCVPAREGGRGTYRFAWLEADTALETDRLGLRQPAVPRWLRDDDRIDLLVAPGLAFDARGGRLGHGGGFYDRLCGAPCAARAFRLGLAFAFQVLDKVPMEEHDARMHAVASESGVTDRGG